jgi:endoglucanase Acf2
MPRLVLVLIVAAWGARMLKDPPRHVLSASLASGAHLLPARTYTRVDAPVPTHRFWAAKNWFPLDKTADGGTYTMIPEPLAVQTSAGGLRVGYSDHIGQSETAFIHGMPMDLTVGVSGLHAAEVLVTGFSDWTVDLSFGPLTARVGRGMPFVYLETDGSNPTVEFAGAPSVFRRSGNLLGVATGENRYGLFCPGGGSWLQEKNVFTCKLPVGKRYFSLALLPSESAFDEYASAAFNVPTETRADWSFDPSTSVVTTRFRVVTRNREGGEAGSFFQALYPHQYASLAQPAELTGQTYVSARGPMKVLRGREFVTRDTYHGILPYLPLENHADLEHVRTLLRAAAAQPDLYAPTDTYGKGKALNRAAQLLALAQMTGDTVTLRKLAQSLREQFSLWAAPGTRAASYFEYAPVWSTVLGFPDSFGSVRQLNDHHFHYGYWIHSAALLEMYDPGWAGAGEAQAMIRQLVADIATISRDDRRFPLLRHFDVYAGHSWASGQAPFGDGQNEESSSEAVNAWAGLILYAEARGDRELRDAAIWMYTQETNAAFDYWFNAGPVPTFPQGFPRVQVANLFDGKSDSATWFGAKPEFEHGIQFLPFTGASLYLGRDSGYCRRNLAEVMQLGHGALQAAEPWADLMAMYQAFYDPDEALRLWQRTHSVFDGETRAHEYAWLRAMAELGRVDTSVTANTPLYAVFRKGDRRIHLAYNMRNQPLEAAFSDGASVRVQPHAMGRVESAGP